MHYRRLHVLLLGVIISSAAILLLAGSWYSYTSTFDTATVGLMSVNILEGDRPLFFYGQPYFGALEAYVAALFLAVFGFSEFVISLSPISFTLGWICFTYLLFTRIHDRTSGIIAAACVAFPGYYIFWYSIATYGGYSAILCLGTAVLWLSLRLMQENSRGRSLFFQSLCLGTCIGLGIWVHPLTFPYIAVAACILIVHTVRQKLRPELILYLGAAASIGLCGFLPFYIETGSFLGGVSESVKVSLASVADALSNLFTVNIRELVVWNFLHIFDSEGAKYIVIYLPLVLLVPASIVACCSFCIPKNKSFKKSNYLIPIFFCFLFLLLYVQHHMATIRAPRYGINFFSMLLCLVWTLAVTGTGKRSVKTVMLFFFCGWVGYQIAGTVYFISGNAAGTRKEQSRVESVVAAAREKNLTSVVTYGDASLGYKAQKFSMFAENTIVFAHADAERYLKNAQFTETDPGKGYLTEKPYKTSLQNTLEDLRVSFSVTPAADFFLFSELQAEQQYSMRGIPRRELRDISISKIKESQEAEVLLDGNQDKGLKRDDFSAEPIIIDTGKIRSLCALWMFGYQNLSIDPWKRPGQYEVFVSVDGMQYKKVYGAPAGARNGFHAGEYIYIGGPLGKMEAMFSPVSARYVKIRFIDKKTPPVTELFVFETEGGMRQSSSGDLKKIEQIIRDEDVDFVLADRWLSASLREIFAESEKKEIALPRHSTKFNNKPLRYFIKAGRGQAMVCDRAVADICSNTLKSQFGDSVIERRIDLQNYTFFSFSDSVNKGSLQDRSALLWNGHVPLQTTDMKLLAPWYHSLGMPVWRSDFTKTDGFYRDGWTNGNGRLTDLDYTIQSGKAKELVLHTYGWRGNVDISSLQLAIIIDDEFFLKFKEKKENSYVFFLPESLRTINTIKIHSNTFVPPGLDTRSLGMDVKRVELQ